MKPDEESKRIFKSMFSPNELSREAIKMIERDLDFQFQKENEKPFSLGKNQGASYLVKK